MPPEREPDDSACRTETRPLHIAICLSWYQPIESGAERQAHRQACELIRRGHRVTVLTRAIPGQPTVQSVDGVEIRRVIRTLPLGPLFGLTFFASLTRALSQLRRQVDLVHCHQGLWEAIAAGWFHGRTQIPTLVQPAAGGPYGEVELLRQTKGSRWLTRLVLKNSFFVAISEQIEQELRELGVEPDRLLRLGSGIDVSQYAPGESSCRDVLPSGTRVLFLGRLHAQKNLPILLEAWQRVQEACSEAKLLLAGDGPDRAALTHFVSEKGLQSSVTFLGAVSEPREYLRASDIFVLPSISEGMSNSLLEAMACGLPPIVSDAGGNTDLVENDVTGLVINAASAEPLAEALLRLLGDKELRQRLGQEARELIVRGYSLTALVDRYEQVYRQLCRPMADEV